MAALSARDKLFQRMTANAEQMMDAYPRADMLLKAVMQEAMPWAPKGGLPALTSWKSSGRRSGPSCWPASRSQRARPTPQTRRAARQKSSAWEAIMIFPVFLDGSSPARLQALGWLILSQRKTA